MKLQSLNLSRQITTATTATTFTLLPRTPSISPLSSPFFRRATPHRRSPAPLRIRSLSLTATSHDVAFSSFSLHSFPSFLSLSSNPISQFLSLSSAASQPSDNSFFTWHRSSHSDTSPGGGIGGKDSDTAAVVLGWLGATQRHLRRYAEIYTARGIDAVTFVVPVNEALLFELGRKVEKRIEVLAKEIVSWLDDNGGRERSLVVHTFSTTGWLVYGSILAYLKESKRPDLVERIKGCIVDSGGDPELNPKVWAAGFTAALVKKRNTSVSTPGQAVEPSSDKNTLISQQDPLTIEVALLFILEKVFTFLFKLPDVNQRLTRIISLLSENQPPCPQLYLYSTADNVIRYQTVESFIEHQKMKGLTVWSHNFGSSPHVDHYRTFPHVYTPLVNNFINELLVKPA